MMDDLSSFERRMTENSMNSGASNSGKVVGYFLGVLAWIILGKDGNI